MCVAFVQPFVIALHALVTGSHHLPRVLLPGVECFAFFIGRQLTVLRDNLQATCSSLPAFRVSPSSMILIACSYEPQESSVGISQRMPRAKVSAGKGVIS
jgi:hypothetical protein